MRTIDNELALEADRGSVDIVPAHRPLKVTSAVLSQMSRQRTVEVEIARPERAI